MTRPSGGGLGRGQRDGSKAGARDSHAGLVQREREMDEMNLERRMTLESSKHVKWPKDAEKTEGQTQSGSHQGSPPTIRSTVGHTRLSLVGHLGGRRKQEGGQKRQ